MNDRREKENSLELMWSLPSCVASFWYESTVRRIKKVLCPRLNFDLSKCRTTLLSGTCLNELERVGNCMQIEIIWKRNYFEAVVMSLLGAFELLWGLCAKATYVTIQQDTSDNSGWLKSAALWFFFFPLPDHASTMRWWKSVLNKDQFGWKLVVYLGFFSAALLLKTLEC